MRLLKTMRCASGFKEVEVLIDGIVTLVCQAMNDDEKRRENKELALILGLAIGIPVFLALVFCCCLCFICGPRAAKPYIT